MSVAARHPHLWTLARRSPSVDSDDLLEAVEAELTRVPKVEREVRRGVLESMGRTTTSV